MSKNDDVFLQKTNNQEKKINPDIFKIKVVDNVQLFPFFKKFISVWSS